MLKRTAKTTYASTPAATYLLKRPLRARRQPTFMTARIDLSATNPLSTHWTLPDCALKNSQEVQPPYIFTPVEAQSLNTITEQRSILPPERTYMRETG